MVKKPKSAAAKRQSQLDWLLAERQAKEYHLEKCADSLFNVPDRPTARTPTPCDVARAVFLAASEYETAAAAVLIAAHEVYTYANAVRQAAMEEMSRQCSPNG